VARSRRPHQNRCHRRVTDRPCSSPPRVCWGPASHRFRSSFSYVGPRQNPSVGHPVRPQSGGFVPRVSARPRLFAPRFRRCVGTLVTHGKAGVCARSCISASFAGPTVYELPTNEERATRAALQSSCRLYGREDLRHPGVSNPSVTGRPAASAPRGLPCEDAVVVSPGQASASWARPSS
jgi:hypothetical protein